MNDGRNVAWIQVGGDCNCRCDHCVLAAPGAKPARPSTAGEVAAAGGNRPDLLILRGPGEPLLRPDLADLIHAARRGGAARVGLVTNGRLLAYPRHAAALARLRPDLVLFTVLHADPAHHDRRARVPGAQAQTLAGLRNLARATRGGTTVLALRAMARPDLDEPRRRAIEGLGQRLGARGSWIDGVDGDATLIDLLDAATGPISRRSRDGSAAPRLHPDEGAVSLVIRTGCRNACLHCTTRIVQEANAAAWPLDDLAAFDEGLVRGARQGLTTLRLVALEPLEHPDVASLLRRAASLGYDNVEAWSSARALADPAWADELAEAGLAAVDIPLLGSTAAIHDEIAGVAGSFEQTMAGVVEARARFATRWHLVLVRQNLDDIDALLALARDRGLGDPASVVVPAPSSDDLGPYSRFAPSWPAVAAAVAALDARDAELLMTRGLHQQIPPCALQRHWRLAPWHGGIRSQRPQTMLSEGSPDDPGAGAKMTAPCPATVTCTHAGRCPGLHHQYVELFGVP